MHATYTSPVIFFDAKSEKIFQNAIMAEQVPYFQLCFDFSTVENSNDFQEFSGEVACNLSSKILSSLIFLSKMMLLSRCVDYFIK